MGTCALRSDNEVGPSLTQTKASPYTRRALVLAHSPTHLVIVGFSREPPAAPARGSSRWHAFLQTPSLGKSSNHPRSDR